MCACPLPADDVKNRQNIASRWGKKKLVNVGRGEERNGGASGRAIDEGTSRGRAQPSLIDSKE